MKVKLTPLDTLFFRDGRAFGENDAHAADSLFPPPPRITFGAWRGAILMAGGYHGSTWDRGKTTGKTWPQWFGSGKGAGSLRQKGPAICWRSENMLFPLPLDLLIDEDYLQPIPLYPVDRSVSSLETPFCLLRSPEQGRLPKLVEDFLIIGDKLCKYLADGRRSPLPAHKALDYQPSSNFWQREDRTNVGIDPDSHSHYPGRLFSLGHVRPQSEISLVCEWEIFQDGTSEALDLVKEGKIHILNLGGEKKAAEVTPVTKPDWPSPPTQLQKNPLTGGFLFRLYFATPTFFQDGWLPQNLTLSSDLGELPVRLLAAAVGKPLYQGGYDIANNRQRAMRRFVPAGSVYFFEADTATDDDIIKLHCQNLGDDEFLRAQGYGLAFVGALSPEAIPADNRPKGGEHV